MVVSKTKLSFSYSLFQPHKLNQQMLIFRFDSYLYKYMYVQVVIMRKWNCWKGLWPNSTSSFRSTVHRSKPHLPSQNKTNSLRSYRNEEKLHTLVNLIRRTTLRGWKLFFTNFYQMYRLSHRTGMTQVHDAAPQQSVRWKTTTTTIAKLSQCHISKILMSFFVCLFLPWQSTTPGFIKVDPPGVKSATSAFGEVFLVAQIEKKK